MRVKLSNKGGVPRSVVIKDQEYVVIFITVIELLVSMLFIAPLPKGWKPALLRNVEESPTIKKIMSYHNFIILAVGLHWAYSINYASDLSDKHTNERQSNFNSVTPKDLYILEQKFLAEGDIYLSGTLLFVSIFINRVVALLQYYYQIKQLSEIELKVDLSLPLEKILKAGQQPIEEKSKESKKVD